MRTRRDESGAVLVLTVIALVVMLGFAALGVDVGLAYAQRRQMQTSADSAALGAAQDLVRANNATLVGGATSFGAQNLPNRSINWNDCATDTIPSGFNAISGSNCISVNSPLVDQIRVRVPKQTFPSLFGGILGIKSLSTSTVAIAGLKHVGNGGGLEPFAVDEAFGSGDYCLDSGGNGNSVAPCDGATTGNFGLLDFAHCGINTGIADDIAIGADHIYVGNPLDPTQSVLDPFVADNCAPAPPRPNTVGSDPGNRVGQETPPLLGGATYSDGGPARLQRVPTNCSAFSPAWETVSASCGSTGAIDNRPLWEFIPLGLGASVPVSCHRETFDALLASTPQAQQRTTLHAALAKCITDYVAAGSTAPVFTANTGGVVDQGLPLFDIQESPRFVYVPQVLEPKPINGRGTYHIKRFRAVFIQRTGANNSKSFFEPGPWNGNVLPDSSAADITGFVLPAPRAGCTPTQADSCGTMLPGQLGSVGSVPVVVGANAVVQLQS